MIKSAKEILAEIADDEPVRSPGRPREYDPICGREGCERPHHAHGLCNPCVRRFVYKTNTRRNRP
jgi:hypothetical protein